MKVISILIQEYLLQVAAVDLLGAWVGELSGGSLREERIDILEPRLKQLNRQNDLSW